MILHFSSRELACRCGCGLERFHPGFLSALELLRIALNRPMQLTSACRCSAHNAAVKGHARSLHVGDAALHPDMEGALAVDVATPDGWERGHLFVKAWNLGWSIGWNAKKGFLHLDRRDYLDMPQTTFDY